MSTILVTYANEAMSTSAKLCVESALRNGCDKAWPQNPDTIDQTFKLFSRDIWQKGNRGADCFWLFKPYVIYKALLQAEPGDIIVYADAGSEFVGNVQQVINCMTGNIMLFNNGFCHLDWCKGDVSLKINGYSPDSSLMADQLWNNKGYEISDYENYQQCQASFQIYRASQEAIDFVKEWLMYCQMPGLIDDSPSKTPNWVNFRDHRHDQAILTCVAIKYGIPFPLHWCPLTMNMHRLDMKLPGDNYPAIINHHRRRDKGFGNGINPEWT